MLKWKVETKETRVSAWEKQAITKQPWSCNIEIHHSSHSCSRQSTLILEACNDFEMIIFVFDMFILLNNCRILNSNQMLLILKKSYHMSSWSSLNIGMLILNFTIRLPYTPCLFCRPWFFTVTLVYLLVISFLSIYIYYPFKWVNDFLNPKIDSSRVIYIK